jgi:hypothetical protein
MQQQEIKITDAILFIFARYGSVNCFSIQVTTQPLPA